MTPLPLSRRRCGLMIVGRRGRVVETWVLD